MTSPELNPADKQRMLDLLVVGLGPAGVSCALQAQRDGLDLLAISDEPIGGLVRAARRLDNLATAPGVSGVELAERMAAQLAQCDVPLTEGLVTRLLWDAERNGFRARLADGRSVRARAVCLAPGTRPRIWNVQSDARWLHRDARSLPPFMHGSRVVVVGGGEAALDTALSARDRGAEVRLLVRGQRLEAASGLVDEIAHSGIPVEANARVTAASRTADGWSLELSDGRGVKADELVACIGRETRDELLQEVCPQDFRRSVVQSPRPGLFLAGDVIRGRDRYVATALGDGQRAAIEAGRFLTEGI